jgi:CRP/FNR family cyclic AMP-dependent transcriptional regulator
MDAAAAELISHPLFSVLSAPAQRDLQEAASRRRVRRLEVIYAPGAPADAAYWVRRGRIKISRLSSDGREITLGFCHSGDLFGEEALVTGAARSCQAQALDDATLLTLPAALFQRSLQEEAAFAFSLARLISTRRELAEEQIENLAFRDVGGRLALLLLSLAAQQGRRLPDGGTLLDTRLTHQELANCVGTTRETLTLTIDRFKTDGWIRLEGRMIAICEPEALRARASNGRPAGVRTDDRGAILGTHRSSS